ncbi:MAG: glycosyltransferase [Actinomycetota bacterium]|nr:glycosyltransferase [Actinomycetota bacterium]
MIVKDESAVIGRCLESVRDIVDSWVIVDTGSTDGTPEIVRALVGDLPGELHVSEWKDFGTNRSELLALARGKADFLLLLDADMTLVCDGPLPDLTGDGYLLEHEGELAYSIPRLVNGSLPWHYVGATHEYLACEEAFTLEPLPSLRVVHHGDGRSRANKLTRDLDLLTQQLEATPSDPRTIFYLAQTCRDLGDRDRAAALFGLRAQLWGFEEESFYAALQHALLIADADWTLGRELLANAWERRPQRVEPLYEIAVRARDRGELAIADWATNLGIGAARPDDIHFVHRYVYDWGMRLERSIACARRGKLAEARAITEELLEEQSLPAPVVAALVANKAWLESRTPRPVRRRSTSRPPRLAQLCRNLDVLGLPTLQAASGWAQTNPSIAAAADGSLACVVRCVGPKLGERSAEADGAASARDVLATLDERLVVTAEAVLQDVDLPRHHSGIEIGFDDCRLFSWRDRLWALAKRPSLDTGGRDRQALLSVGNGRYELTSMLEDPGASRHENQKIWMPFVLAGELCVVSCCRPFTVLRFDDSRSRLEELVRMPTDCRFAGLRGGSPGLAVDDGFLFITHQLVDLQGTWRYLHRFVAVDGSLSPSGISDPFTFAGNAFEVCAGMASRGDGVVLSFGIGDRSSALATAPLGAIISLIEPL